MSKSSMDILDWDEIGYELDGCQYFNFKMAFAGAASAIIPGLKFGHAFKMAMRGWKDHTDGAAVFVNQYGGQSEQQRKKLADDIDRLAHSILPTDKWKPIEGLAKAIQDIQDDAQVIVWTHGHKKMVLRTMDKLGLYGLISEKDIYDKRTPVFDPATNTIEELGRKDSGIAPYHRICRIRDVKPEHTSLIDDTYKNHISAAAAGLQNNCHVHWGKPPELSTQHVGGSFPNTVLALQWLKAKHAETSQGLVTEPSIKLMPAPSKIAAGPV